MRERKVSARDVTRMASEMEREIADLEQRLAMLRTDRASASGRRGAKKASRSVNPAVAASRRLQGEYMGLMRHITGRERTRIKKIAAEQGREAAVKEMRSSVGR
jgi:phage shock protein A